MAGIPLNWLINIISVSVKQIFSLSKLPTLLITKFNQNLITSKWAKYYNAEDVIKEYGANSSVGDFARNYFAVINKMASRPDLLNILTYNPDATKAVLKGATVRDLGKIKVNGAFSITIGEHTKDITFNATQAVSFSDVAIKIQEALVSAGESNITEFKDATCVYDSYLQCFKITSGASGALSISYASEPTSGTDVSNELGLSESAGATTYDGRDAVGSFDNLLNEISIDNGAYFVITTDWELSESEQESLAKFISNSNNRYLGIINSTNKKLLSDESTSANLKGYNGIILNYHKDIRSVNGFTAGLISAINFSQTNGNVNLAFSDATQYATQAIQTESELNILEANLANSILEFSQIGQSQAWYGMGNIMGTLTNSANVYIGNAYLAFQLQLQFANMFNAQGFIGLRGRNNEGIITAYAESVFVGCVNNGIIVQGAELTTTEKQKLISVFGDKGESAITQCSRNGYFYLIGTPDLVNQTLPISVAYVANKAVKRLIVTNYVLGA